MLKHKQANVILAHSTAYKSKLPKVTEKKDNPTQRKIYGCASFGGIDDLLKSIFLS